MMRLCVTKRYPNTPNQSNHTTININSCCNPRVRFSNLTVLKALETKKMKEIENTFVSLHTVCRNISNLHGGYFTLDKGVFQYKYFFPIMEIFLFDENFISRSTFL